MASIREWLDSVGFDWDNGRIIVHDTTESSPGWAMESEITARREVDRDDPVVTREFSPGFGGPECPRFVAMDGERLFYPSQYDGATSINYVCVNLDRYLEGGSMTPYPGNG